MGNKPTELDAKNWFDEYDKALEYMKENGIDKDDVKKLNRFLECVTQMEAITNGDSPAFVHSIHFCGEEYNMAGIFVNRYSDGGLFIKFQQDSFIDALNEQLKNGNIAIDTDGDVVIFEKEKK